MVADDLTGACDSSAPFLRGGRVVVALWPPALRPPAGLACLATSTDSRSQEAEVSRQRARQAAAWLCEEGAERLFRKLDSTLRGNQVADVAGTLDAWPGLCMVAPALPAEQRITRNGIQFWPGGMVDLRELFAGLGDRVRVRDAETAADLSRLAAEVVGSGATIPAGTAGLASALALLLAPARQPPVSDLSGLVKRPLALIGSTVAGPQGEYAAAQGWTVRHRLKTDPIDLGGHDGLFLCGGSTAAGVLGALGATGLELLGELAPRVPAARILGGPEEGRFVALKSGHFGPLEVIDQALRRFTGRG